MQIFKKLDNPDKAMLNFSIALDLKPSNADVNQIKVSTCGKDGDMLRSLCTLGQVVAHVVLLSYNSSESVRDGHQSLTCKDSPFAAGCHREVECSRRR